MNNATGMTIWERLGAASGLWAVLWLGIHYAILGATSADPHASDPEFARALLGERMQWEWVTFLRILGGLMIIWFMGSLVGRLRMLEGEPGRLATIAGALGTVWGAVWLVSALFNSVSITMAQWDHAAGARLAGALGRQTLFVLTPAIVFALVLTSWYVAVRFGGFPRAYTPITFVLSLALLILAIVEWYGAAHVGTLIMVLALGWMAMTSALLVPKYRPAEGIPEAR